MDSSQALTAQVSDTGGHQTSSVFVGDSNTIDIKVFFMFFWELCVKPLVMAPIGIVFYLATIMLFAWEIRIDKISIDRSEWSSSGV